MKQSDNMKQNMVADDELDQVTGGRNLFDIFTAEFRGKAGKAATLEMNPEDENNSITVSTLEMRTDPLKKQESRKTGTVVKL